jgi:succinyl-diaminopimelate desuccinylase
MEPTLALCQQLIACPSVTPEDAGCQDIMAERLRKLGFHCSDLVFGEVRNLWALRGSEGPLLVFAGHTDVVPPGPLERWDSPPFEPTLRDGLLFGRGAADMKGSLAAMVIAVEQFVGACPQHHGRIGFLITSDEEGPAVNGTVKVIERLQQEGIHIDWCLVGEPSSHEYLGDTIKNGRRGSLGAQLTVHGIQGHVAYPQLADNPIHRAMPALHALASEHWDNGNSSFPPTTFQLSNISAGTGATNVIPGELQATFNFRFSTELTEVQLRQRTEAILDQHGLDYSLEWNLSGIPFITERGALIEAAVDSIRDVTGRETQLSTAGGTSDGRFIAPTGAQVVEVGPVNASIHQRNEHLRVDDLPQLTAIYRGVLEKLLAQ